MWGRSRDINWIDLKIRIMFLSMHQGIFELWFFLIIVQFSKAAVSYLFSNCWALIADLQVLHSKFYFLFTFPFCTFSFSFFPQLGTEMKHLSPRLDCISAPVCFIICQHHSRKNIQFTMFQIFPDLKLVLADFFKC